MSRTIFAVIAVCFLLYIAKIHGLFVSGTPLFGGSETLRTQSGKMVVRASIFDDVGLVHQYQPTAELYALRRPKWLCAVEDAQQLSEMPPIVPEILREAGN
jgi:hypothetical protein